MDQMTRSRNLQLFLRQRLITLRMGDDRRAGVVSLICEGERAIQVAWPLWQAAQARMEQAFGQTRFDALLDVLAAIRAAAR